MAAIFISIGTGFFGWLIASITDLEMMGILGMIVGILSPMLYMTEKIYKIKTKEIPVLQLKIKELEKKLDDKR